ncbi:MAG: ACP S-malonyltransferase [Bacteroidetes bacterium]|nr:ACP S-malonyltransferase [Bacteroidota bacterium]
MKTAWVFPGQASQYVGMTSDFRQSSAEAADFIRQADRVLGFPISDIMIAGPEDQLKQTEITQPAIFIHSLLVARFLKGEFHAVAGHSLGEYSALCAAGVFDFETGLKLVRLRGELMQKAGTDNPGTMAAVVGATPDAVAEACREASSAGIVQPANFNSPGQIVISGSVDGVRRAMEIAKTKGAKIVKELVVSGAFHSPLMASASEKLGHALQTTEFKTPSVAVYTNVTAEPVTDPATLKSLSLKQLTSPVLWENSVVNMSRDGIGRFVEVGPGKVLQGLIKRTVTDAVCLGVDKFSELEGATA